MHLALELVALVVTILAVVGVARRIDVPAPILLVAVGVLASYLPVVPEVRLTPELVLVGLLPPLLYNAALQTSLVDFTTYRRPILGLSVGLVVFTTVGVGVLVHAILPGISWGAALALGAVVAPPDAVAATAIARRIGLPRPIVTVLEGESLVNDATALVSLNTAILAATASVAVLEVGVDFVRTAVGGVLAGVLVYVVVGKVRRVFRDPVGDTSLSLVVPFAAYLLAEEAFHASGILAVVIAGLLLGHKAPLLQTPSSRIAERLNWRTISFLLENAVFLLIGLQTSWILAEVGDSDVGVGTVAALCLGVLVAVVVLRLVWVSASRLTGLVPRLGGDKPPRSYSFIVGWAGMRGVVTLAAAFAIPPEVPDREVLLVVALVVTGGTLLLHGLTLPWVVRRLHVPGPDPRQDALARAELLAQASRAGLDRLAEEADDEDEAHSHVRESLRHRLEQREFAAWERLGPEEVEGETPSERYARLRRDMLQAERARVLEIRSTGRVPHEVVEDVLAALDVEESMIDVRAERRERLAGRSPTTGGLTVESCEHLEDAPPRELPDERVCVDCVREGTSWVHLRMCVACGHVGCCDSSPRRHASAHFRAEDHPVVRSAEPGEDWRWCFVDELVG